MKKEKKSPAWEKTKEFERFQEMLWEADDELLRDFLTDYAVRNTEFREEFTAALAEMCEEYGEYDEDDAYDKEEMEEFFGFFGGLLNAVFDKQGAEESVIRQVERNIRQEEYTLAEELCLEEVTKEQQTLSKYANTYQWDAKLAEIYSATGEDEKLADVARRMVLQYGMYRDYELLKTALTKCGRWEENRESLLDALAEMRWKDRYANILGAEGESRRLLDLLETTPELNVFAYGAELAKEFPDEVAVLYRSKLEKVAEAAGKRAEYREICDHLETLAGFAEGETTVRGILEGFRLRYRRRVAFMEELSALEERLKGRK